MRFKTLIPAILALIIGLHALSALAFDASRIDKAFTNVDVDARAVAKQLKEERIALPKALTNSLVVLDAGAVAKQLKQASRK